MLKGVFHMTYAEKIKKLRMVMLVTQQELADLLSVSVVTVNRWENNKFEPTMKEKRKLVKLFKDNKIGEGHNE
jgi:DNA-binding XRE family transcriptional regulator